MPCKSPDAHVFFVFMTTLITHRSHCLSATVPAGGSSGGEVTSQCANPANNKARQAQNCKVPGGESIKGHNLYVIVTFLLCIFYLFIYLFF